MYLIPRSASLAAPLSLALVLVAGTAASAQVASLATPDESPAPDEAEVVLEFADREEALLAFTQCMRDNGVEMDDPTGDGRGRGFLRPEGQGGFDRFGEEFQVAQEACGAILESARPEVDPEAEQERLEEQLQLAQCFRDNGYPEYPDPEMGSDGRVERGGQAIVMAGIDRRSEDFQNMRISCADQIGIEAFGRGGPGGGN